MRNMRNISYACYDVHVTRPTNILLDESSRAAARRRAAERGLSLSGYVRELIRADDAATRHDPGDISAVIGVLGSSGEPTDIARDKHEMIAQAFDDGFTRKRHRRDDPA